MRVPRDECGRSKHPRDRQGWDFIAELIPDSLYDRGSDRMDYAIIGVAAVRSAAETRFQLIITHVGRLFRSSNNVHRVLPHFSRIP